MIWLAISAFATGACLVGTIWAMEKSCHELEVRLWRETADFFREQSLKAERENLELRKKMHTDGDEWKV